MKVTVVGAGIVGCSLAQSLVALGHTVSLVDPHEPGSGTTGTSFAWINSHKKHPLSYHELNLRGVETWSTTVAARYPHTVYIGGHVEVAESATHRESLRARVARLTSLNYPAEIIDVATARALTPVTTSDDAIVARFPSEGHAYPVEYCEAVLAELAQSRLFSLHVGRVSAITANTATVTVSDGETIEADAVVICAGTATAALAELAGAPLPLVPEDVDGPAFGYLAIVDAPGHGLTGLITTDEVNLRPDGPNRVIAQVLDLDGTADPMVSPPDDLATTIGARVAAVLPRTTIGTVTVRVGHRVIPADGLTTAGPLIGSVWAVATHSGVVLGPWLGAVIAAEMDGGDPNPLLADFRPARFSTSSPAIPSALVAPRRPGDQ